MMSEPKFTPGPLFVRQPERWPFDVEIVDASGEVISRESRHSYNSKQETIEDVMTAYRMRSPGDPNFAEECIAANQKQLANAYLRAAAPDLFDALKEIIDTPWLGGKGGFHKARAAIAKALGEST